MTTTPASEAAAVTSPQLLSVAPVAAAPLPPRVEIEFVYTFQELREGLTQSPEIKQLNDARRPLYLILWVLFATVMVLASLLLQLGRPPATAVPGSPGPRTIDALIALVPSLLCAGLVACLAATLFVTMRLLHSPDPRQRERIGQVLLGGGMFLFVMLWGDYQIFSVVPASRTWPVSRGTALILALAPWMILIAAAALVLVRYARGQVHRQWNNKPFLRRRRRVVLDADGERVSDGVIDSLHRWPYFRRAWETVHCLVLQDESDLRHVLPKRVMDQPTLEAARAVIANHIADTKFLTTPGGFPVAMAATV